MGRDHTEIRQRLDLPMLGRHNSLIHGILMHLCADGYKAYRSLRGRLIDFEPYTQREDETL